MTGLKTRIETPLFQESVTFYSELLGMTVLQSWDHGADKGAILGLGSSAKREAFLELAEVESSGAYRGMSLQFRVRDLAAFANGLGDRVEFRGPEKRPWGSSYLFLKDPIGIQVIVYEGAL